MALLAAWCVWVALMSAGVIGAVVMAHRALTIAERLEDGMGRADAPARPDAKGENQCKRDHTRKSA